MNRKQLQLGGRALCAMAIVALLPALGAADGRASGPAGGTALSTARSLEADGQRVYLSLHGPIKLAGDAPLPLSDAPPGEYRYACEGPGLYHSRGRLVLSAAGVEPRRYGGPGAALQPPGLLHLQRGESRGWIYLGAGATAAAVALWRHGTARNAADERELAAEVYARAVAQEEIAAARHGELRARYEEADYKELRDLWLGFLAAGWVGASLEAWLLTPGGELAADGAGIYRLQLPRAGRLGSALRSALVPGAGQRALGREASGNFYLAAVAALTAGAIVAHDAYLEASRDQQLAQVRYDRARAEAEVRATRDHLERAAERADDRNLVRWSIIAAAAGVYLWNVVDAAGLGRPLGSERVAWSVAPTTDGVQLAASWRR